MVHRWIASTAIHQLRTSELQFYLTIALVQLSQHFAHLPIELCDEIVQLLQHDDLKALICVNKTIRNTFLPSLKYCASYFEITDHKGRYQGYRYPRRDAIKVLRCWKSYIEQSFRSRKFALCVTDFRFYINRIRPRHRTREENEGILATQFYASPLSWGDIVVAGKFVKRVLSLSTTVKVLKGLRGGYLDATLVVLICLMGDLRNLTLPLSLVRTSPILKAALPELLPRCRSLVSANIGGICLNRQMQVVKLISNFDWPIHLVFKRMSGETYVATSEKRVHKNQLVKLVKMVTDNIKYNGPWPFPDPVLDRLETLSLAKSGLSLDEVVTLITASPTLTALQCEHRFPTIGGANVYDCKKLSFALEGAQFRMERLIIACRYDIHENSADQPPIRGSLGGILKQFTKLHWLDIPPVILLGEENIEPSTDLTDSLPTGLKTLILRADSALRGEPWWMMRFMKILDDFVRRGIHLSKMSRLGLFEMHLSQYYKGRWAAGPPELWTNYDELSETYSKLLSKARIRGGIDRIVSLDSADVFDPNS